MKTKFYLTILAILSSLNMAHAQNVDQSIEVATDFINNIPISLSIQSDYQDGSGASPRYENGYLSFYVKLPSGVSLDYVYAKGVLETEGDWDLYQIYTTEDRYGGFTYDKDNNSYHVTIQHCFDFSDGKIKNNVSRQLDSIAQNKIKEAYDNGIIHLGLKVSNSFSNGLVEISNIEELTYLYDTYYNTYDNFSFYIKKTDNPIESYVAKNSHSSYKYTTVPLKWTNRSLKSLK